METTTGPLGQGLANGVGMAMAEAHLAACFKRPGAKVVNHHTYVMCGDGDLMEGVAAEAASLAGHLGLAKLICIYDDNQITIEGSTDITFSEDVAKRFESYNWQVLKVSDGNDLAAIDTAIDAAKADDRHPTLIMVRTQIAYGSPNKQGTSDAHGAPLGEEEVCLTKACLGCPEDADFCVPQEVLDHCRPSLEAGQAAESKWQAVWDAYKTAYPDLAAQFEEALHHQLPDEWDAELPQFEAAEGPLATRAASGMVLNSIASRMPALMGGSADLAPSNKTLLDGSHDYQKDHYDGRNIRFGVREHAMGSILSGMYLHGGIRPYGGTFLVFADYMRPAIRLAGLMKLPVIYVFTHDSIAVGEDGPTHQPVEHLASLRSIPNLTVIRPADAAETAEAWRQALLSQESPVALILSRQKLPVLDRSACAPAQGLSQGAYVVKDCVGDPDIIIIGTGSELHIALEAQEALTADGVAVRVVSMPSWELFEQTPPDYKEQVLPANVSRRLAVEAGIPMGWRKYGGIAAG